MADANLKIPSEERIRFNASESIINAVSPRVDITTIPGGHRMRVTDIDGVETADIMDGVKGDTGDAAGFGTVSASVDANVGTPSVTVTSSGPNTAKNFDISFKNLKGVKGDTGDAAGFGTVSASVDANVGTPSVTVTSSGPNTAKNFDISFKNLKGNTGAAAGFDTPTASVDGYIGTPSVAVTATGPATAKKFDFAFHNLKGEKGDTGSIEDLIVDGTEPEEGAGVSVDGPISELSAEGWATQESTTGKNLAPSPTSGTISAGGLTIENLFDGTFIVNGTSTAVVFCNGLRTSLSAGTYRASVSDPSIFNVLVRVFESSGNTDVYYGSGGVFTLDSDKGQVLVTAVCPIGKTYQNIKGWFQLELGSTATEYEPYTGGAPSPSPDYPQEIEVAKGRNLIDTESGERGLLTTSGTIDMSLSNHWYTTDYIAVEGAGDYFLQGMKGTGNTSDTLRYGWYGSDKSFISRLTGINVKITAPSNAAYVRVCWCDDPSVATSYVHTVQLTLGATPQPYVPYGHVGMEVQGKNLLSHIDQTRNERTYTQTDEGIYVEGNLVSGSVSYYYPIGGADAYATIRLEAGTYTFDNGGVPSNQCAVHMQTVIDGVRSVLFSNQARKTFTLEEDTDVIPFATFGSSLSSDTYAVQLVKGSSVPTYEPYHHTTTPIPLPSRGWVGSLPDGTADILHLDGAGKVEWEKKMDEVVLDGSTNKISGVNINSNSTRCISQAVKTLIRPIKSVWEGINLAATHFLADNRPITSMPTVDKGFISYFIDNNLYFTLDKAIASVTDANTWLSAHPVTVLYPLAEPQTESLGYIDLPDIPAGSTVSIPELDALGISYYVDNGAVRKLAEQYKARLEATSFADIEDAVTELAAEVQQNTNRTQLYFGYDTVNGKQMISVFKRNV